MPGRPRLPQPEQGPVLLEPSPLTPLQVTLGEPVELGLGFADTPFFGPRPRHRQARLDVARFEDKDLGQRLPRCRGLPLAEQEIPQSHPGGGEGGIEVGGPAEVIGGLDTLTAPGQQKTEEVVGLGDVVPRGPGPGGTR